MAGWTSASSRVTWAAPCLRRSAANREAALVADGGVCRRHFDPGAAAVERDLLADGVEEARPAGLAVLLPAALLGDSVLEDDSASCADRVDNVVGLDA